MGGGLPPLPSLETELQDMMDVLLGRIASPIDVGLLTLMEVADAYFARGSEMAMLILGQERQGYIAKGGHYAKFRTGELRHFLEVCKGARELGSRRITARQLQLESERTGREHLEDI